MGIHGCKLNPWGIERINRSAGIRIRVAPTSFAIGVGQSTKTALFFALQNQPRIFSGALLHHGLLTAHIGFSGLLLLPPAHLVPVSSTCLAAKKHTWAK